MKSSNGVGLGIVDDTRPHPGGKVRYVFLFNRRQRAVQEKRVDVGSNVLVIKKYPALHSAADRAKEDSPFFLQKPKEFFLLGIIWEFWLLSGRKGLRGGRKRAVFWRNAQA